MRPYPLAVLVTVREREEEDARVGLARALAAEATRAAELEASGARRAAHARRLERELVELSRAARSGDGAALAARSRWVARLRGEVAALADAEDLAAAALQGARADADEARETLADARSALRVLERHREGWRAEARRRREGAEEAEADDRVSARAGS